MVIQDLVSRLSRMLDSPCYQYWNDILLRNAQSGRFQYPKWASLHLEPQITRRLGMAPSIRPPQTQPGKVSLDSPDWDIPQTETFAEVYVLWLGIRTGEKFSGIPAAIGSREKLRPPGYILHCEMAGL